MSCSSWSFTRELNEVYTVVMEKHFSRLNKDIFCNCFTAEILHSILYWSWFYYFINSLWVQHTTNSSKTDAITFLVDATNFHCHLSIVQKSVSIVFYKEKSFSSYLLLGLLFSLWHVVNPPFTNRDVDRKTQFSCAETCQST